MISLRKMCQLILTISATENIGDTLLTVLTQYRAEGKQVLDLQVSQGSLEEYFLQIVKGEGSQ